MLSEIIACCVNSNTFYNTSFNSGLKLFPFIDSLKSEVERVS